MLFTSNLQLWSSQLGFDVKSINATPIWNITNGCANLSPVVGAIVVNSFSIVVISVYVSLFAIVLLCCNFQVASFVCVCVVWFGLSTENQYLTHPQKPFNPARELANPMLVIVSGGSLPLEPVNGGSVGGFSPSNPKKPNRTKIRSIFQWKFLDLARS